MASPEIRKCYQLGLINRRALARRIINDSPNIKQGQFEAIIALLRRTKLPKQDKMFLSALPQIRIVIKDKIAIVNLVKSKELVRQLERLIAKISYDKNETFKFVIGTDSVKVFIDEKNLCMIDDIVSKKDIIYKLRQISEISLLFPEKSADAKGIVAYLTSALSVNDVIIEEFLSCSPELLLYVKEEQALKAYETIKKLQ